MKKGRCLVLLAYWLIHELITYFDSSLNHQISFDYLDEVEMLDDVDTELDEEALIVKDMVS